MPQFVILHHEHPRGAHFDLMLEVGDVLRTWALPQPPQAGVEMECEALGNHRRAYLDYQGPVSGGRGTVTRWDQGTYTVIRQTDKEWVVDLAGEKINGRMTLQSLAGAANRWVFSLVAMHDG
jgi:hypothetical protein